MNSMLAWPLLQLLIDNIVIFSTNFEEYLHHLEAVSTRLDETGLTQKPPKIINLAASNYQYVGHMVGAGEVRPLKAKIKVLMQYHKPVKKKDMRAFLVLQTATDALRFSSSTTDKGN